MNMQFMKFVYINITIMLLTKNQLVNKSKNICQKLGMNG